VSSSRPSGRSPGAFSRPTCLVHIKVSG
jgi:hypothetical protein